MKVALLVLVLAACSLATVRPYLLTTSNPVDLPLGEDAAEGGMVWVLTPYR
jgi:hypothetical protein